MQITTRVKRIRHLAVSLVGALLFAGSVCATGSNTASDGSAMISQGVIAVGDGASHVLAQGASTAVEFTVELIEITGELAQITLTTGVKASQTSAQVMVSIASATVASLAISTGSLIEIIAVYAQDSTQVLGYLLMQQSHVLLFVTENESDLILSSKAL